MPRHARRTFRRKFRRTGRKFSRGTFRRKVRAVIRRDAETKFHITNVSSNVNSSAPLEFPFFSGIGQGVLPTQRIGSKLVVQRWGFNLKSVFTYATAGSFVSQVRIMVLYPRKGVDSDTLSTYLTGVVPGLYGRADPTLFMTLYDKWFIVGATSGGGLFSGNSPPARIHKFMKRGRFSLNYQTTNVIDREPILYITAGISAVDTSFVTVVGYITSSFKDM